MCKIQVIKNETFQLFEKDFSLSSIKTGEDILIVQQEIENNDSVCLELTLWGHNDGLIDGYPVTGLNLSINRVNPSEGSDYEMIEDFGIIDSTEFKNSEELLDKMLEILKKYN